MKEPDKICRTFGGNKSIIRWSPNKAGALGLGVNPNQLPKPEALSLTPYKFLYTRTLNLGLSGFQERLLIDLLL